MKKFILSLAALVLAAGFVSAQDLATATETYNNGAEQLSTGDKAAALASFQEALKMGEALGEDGEELVINCKNAIPNIILSMGKDLVKAEDYSAAIAKIQEAATVAKEYGNDSVEKDATTLIPQVKLQVANKAFQAKEFAEAAAGYKEVLAADSTNKNASLRLVQCYANSGDIEAATEALSLAEANGMGDNAKKVLGSAYLKEVQNLNKAGKQADAIALVDKAEELDIVTNAAIYQLAGSAASKLGKNADAIKYYEKFLDKDPSNKNAGAIAYTVGALYQGQNNKAKALEFYKKAVASGYADAQKMVDTLSK